MNNLKIPFPFVGRANIAGNTVSIDNNIDSPYPLTVEVAIKIPLSYCVFNEKVDGFICKVRQLGTGDFELIPIKT